MDADSAIEEYGWTAVPRDSNILLSMQDKTKKPAPQTVDSMPLPNTPLAKAVMEYAVKELKEETFNHSMRVYYYGRLRCSQRLAI